jgi:hypothetical protein
LAAIIAVITVVVVLVASVTTSTGPNTSAAFRLCHLASRPLYPRAAATSEV